MKSKNMNTAGYLLFQANIVASTLNKLVLQEASLCTDLALMR